MPAVPLGNVILTRNLAQMAFAAQNGDFSLAAFATVVLGWVAVAVPLVIVVYREVEKRVAATSG